MYLSKPCRCLLAGLSWCAFAGAPFALAEIPEVDPAAEGPWSDIERTTLTVPLVPNGSVILDGTVSQEEYGNFPGQLVNPGENAYILNFPGDRQWDDEADSSFTFWLAHDEEYFYVGIDAKDEILNQDDPTALWKDDSVEIIVDALNDRYDVNTDSSMDAYGGHNYVSYNGKFSDWDHEADIRSNMRWTSALEWTWGEDGEIFAVGSEVDGGWHLDVRFAKTLFEDPAAGNKLENGYVMGFNIGLDDDDKFGPGENGDASREQDLELQYWWANRLRAIGWTAEEAEGGAVVEDFELAIDPNGRLTHGGTGEIIFASDNPFELKPGPNITVSAKKQLGQLDSANPTYSEIVTVRNTGTENTLTITGVNVSGADRALFSVDEFPATIAPQESADIKFTFSPEGRIGEFAAVFEVVNDDVDADDQTRLIEVTASVVNLQGPIAHYSLDEAAGATEMLDVTGFGRHGTFVGSATPGEAALATGSAVKVADGGYGSVDGRQFKFESFTVSMWFNADGGDGFQTLFGQGDAGGSPTYALLATSGDLQWFVGEAPLFATSGGVYTDGTTHHVAVSYNNESGDVVIYVDGVEVANEGGLDPLVVEASSGFVMGSYNAALPFNGVLDDVQFYDRVLSVEDINLLKDTPGSVIGGTTPPGGGGGASITWSEVDLDTTVADLIGGSSITFTPFVYPVDNSNDGTFWTGAGGTTGDADLDAIYNSHGWAADGTSITLEGLAAGEIYLVQLLGAGDTRDCCNTRNQAASDGTNVSRDFPRGNSSVIGSFTATGATQELMIVSGIDNGVDPGLSGYILTGAEGALIAAYNVGTDGGDITVSGLLPSGLDGYWSFDEGAGTAAADGSGEGRDAAFRNGEPTWVAGKSGGALAFDGDDDLTVSGWKGISGAAPRAVSYWLKTDWAVDAAAGTIGWGANATGLKWHLRLNENGGNGPVGAIRTEIQGSFLVGTKVINDDQWHHVVSIFPEGGQFMQDLIHYVDGELQEVGGTGSVTVEVNTAGEAESGTDVTFGSRLQAADQFYIGALDDISIWSRAISAEEVQALFQGTTPTDVAAGNLGGGGGGEIDGAPALSRVSRTAGGVAIGVPDGQTYDIQYSQDLVTWETIANGATGSYEDTDGARTGGAAGYYRGLKP
jgi:hypothetical protein